MVDDNSLNLRVAEKLLKPYHVDVTCCKSGIECIDRIKEQNIYDIIFMDIMMPGMGGVEALKELLQLPGFHTPVIALTADAIQGKANKYMEVGFHDYIAKPIETKELSRILSKYLQGSKTSNREKQSKVDIPYLKEHGVDVDHSIELLGSIDMYHDILQTFLSENKERTVKMKQYIEEENMGDYAILVHALKSDSKYLGLNHLADLSYRHEQEAKAGNFSYIKTHYDELMQEVMKMTDIIVTYLHDISAKS